MQPDAVSGGQIGQGLQIIEGPHIHRPRRRRDQERTETGLDVRLNTGLQGLDIHLEIPVQRNPSESVPPQSRHLHGPDDAGMGPVRRIGRQPGLAPSMRPNLRPQRPGPCRQTGHEIGHGGPGDEQPLRALGKAEPAPDPQADLLLQGDAHMVAPAAVHVQPGGQHLRQGPNRRAAPLHPAHESRMAIAPGIGHHGLKIVRIDLLHRDRRSERRRAEGGPHRVRHGLPHRSVRQTLQLVHQIVDHPPPQDTERLPVLRIEGGRAIHRGDVGLGHARAVRLSP